AETRKGLRPVPAMSESSAVHSGRATVARRAIAARCAASEHTYWVGRSGRVQWMLCRGESVPPSVFQTLSSTWLGPSVIDRCWGPERNVFSNVIRARDDVARP